MRPNTAISKGDDQTSIRVKYDFSSLRFTKEDGEWRVHPERFRAKRNELLEKRIVTFEGQRDDVISELLKMRGIDSGLTPALRQPLRQPSG